MYARKLLLPLIVLAVLFTACAEGVQPGSDNSDSNYAAVEGGIPIDGAFYTLTGSVIGDVKDHERQVSPAQGSFSMYGTYGGGTYFGPEFTGKGLVRVKVVSLDPVNEKLVKPGDVAILKVSDLKARALLPDDVVVFRCRAQYEAVAPIEPEERFNVAQSETWELDFCRMKAPHTTIPS